MARASRHLGAGKAAMSITPDVYSRGLPDLQRDAAEALALTDHSGLRGAMEFAQCAPRPCLLNPPEQGPRPDHDVAAVRALGPGAGGHCGP
jgi:hypothetical protein